KTQTTQTYKHQTNILQKQQPLNKHYNTTNPTTKQTTTTIKYIEYVLLPLEKLPHFCTNFYKIKKVYECCYALNKNNIRYPTKIIREANGELSPKN
ncbi:hypothetical protein Mgra_00006174, partial [Meloidogyne graminicola]